MTKEQKQQKQRVFLDALAEGFTVSGSALRAGLSRCSAYAWRRDDASFAAAWEDAMEAGCDRLEDIATEHALKGSERMLTLLLRSKRHEYGRRKKEEKSGNGVVHLPVMAKSTEEWLAIYGPQTDRDPTES